MTLSEFPPPPLDAVRILRREHEVLRRMFLTFTRVRHDSGERRREGDIVGRICLGLSLHERAEQEVVMPALLGSFVQAEAKADPADDVAFAAPFAAVVADAGEGQEHPAQHLVFAPQDPDGIQGRGREFGQGHVGFPNGRDTIRCRRNGRCGLCASARCQRRIRGSAARRSSRCSPCGRWHSSCRRRLRGLP
ncbi:MAG TPA: hemerythrin domain-containing protein, partial [Gemmatimonadales bacterium]|nr:hemerythrin domain-containing protein [Gemmatimonadales bacterium]